jgi:hypothetical protein
VEQERQWVRNCSTGTALHLITRLESEQKRGLRERLSTYRSKVAAAISAIRVPEGPQASLDVASRTLHCMSLYPLARFFLFHGPKVEATTATAWRTATAQGRE